MSVFDRPSAARSTIRARLASVGVRGLLAISSSARRCSLVRRNAATGVATSRRYSAAVTTVKLFRKQVKGTLLRRHAAPVAYPGERPRVITKAPAQPAVTAG